MFMHVYDEICACNARGGGGESAHQHSRNESCASALERAKSTHASALAGTKSAYQRSCVQIARKNSVRYKSVQTSTRDHILEGLETDVINTN